MMKNEMVIDMKLYYWDCSWRGSIVVIATSIESAHQIASTSYNYPGADCNPVVYDIEDGLHLVNLGDC